MARGRSANDMLASSMDTCDSLSIAETVTKVDHPQTVEFCTRLEICNPFGFNPGLYKPLPQATSTLETPFQANPDEISLDDLDNQEDGRLGEGPEGWGSP